MDSGIALRQPFLEGWIHEESDPMKRLLTGLLGVVLLGAGAYLFHTGQPDEGAYRYPAEARQEAREFARTIKDPAARDRFLQETTGRVKVEHRREMFAGGLFTALGFGLALISVRPSGRKSTGILRRAA